MWVRPSRLKGVWRRLFHNRHNAADLLETACGRITDGTPMERTAVGRYLLRLAFLLLAPWPWPVGVRECATGHVRKGLWAVARTNSLFLGVQSSRRLLACLLRANTSKHEGVLIRCCECFFDATPTCTLICTFDSNCVALSRRSLRVSAHFSRHTMILLPTLQRNFRV